MLLILGILIFVVVFYCIITEKVPSAYATMLGALTMAFFRNSERRRNFRNNT